MAGRRVLLISPIAPNEYGVGESVRRTTTQLVAAPGMTIVRWHIFFFLILGTVAMNQIDRLAFSVVMSMITREFAISQFV